MKNLLIVLSLIFVFQHGEKHEKILDIEIVATGIELGASNNIYTIEGPKISMYDLMGELQYSYSNMYTKNLYSVDVSNPEKILLFYKEDQKITIINNYFRVIPKPFILSEKGYSGIDLACLSDDDNIWIFSQPEQTLIKLTDQGDFITQSNNLEKEMAIHLNPSFMTINNGELYISDPEVGILVFDQIGEHIKTIPKKGIEHFRIENNNLFFTRMNKGVICNLSTLEERTIDLPFEKYRAATLNFQEKNVMVFMAGKNSVEVFEFPVVEK